MRKKKNIVIVLGAGDGIRFGKKTPKIFAKIAGKEVISYTLKKFEKHRAIDEIIVVVRKGLVKRLKDLVSGEGLRKVSKIIAGGETRQASARIGLAASLASKSDNILFHDGVRPFVSHRIISEVLKTLKGFSAVTVAFPSSDTLVRVNKGMIIKDIPARAALLREQTPQGFHFPVIKKAHDMALKKGIKNISDDCGLVLKYGLADIYVVKGERENIKITYPIDIAIGEGIMADRK